MDGPDCARLRIAVMDGAVEGRELPEDLQHHVERCRRCCDLLAGVAVAPQMMADGPTVSDALRRRTLAAVRSDQMPWAAVLVAAVAGLVNLAGTVLLPTALLERWLVALLPAPLALLAAMGIVLSLGLAGAVLLVVVVLDRTGLVPVLEVSS